MKGMDVTYFVFVDNNLLSITFICYYADKRY